MKKIINSMLMLAMAAMTFVSCEDVPEPYSWPTPPDTGNEEEVITPQGSGTLEDPYNVAAAQALIQTLGADVQSEEIYVKGFISQIDDISPVPETTYGNATYWISDQKGSTAGQLEIYRGYSLGGEKFTSKDEIKEDDEVIVKGKVVNFRGSTPEFTTGSSIYSLNGKTADEGGGNTQPGGEIKKVTIAEFNAAAESNDVWYELTGTVKNLKDGDQYGNFDLEDETGSVYVYGLLAEKDGEKKKFQDLVAAKGIKEGSKITIIGTRGSYNEKIEVMNAYFVSIESGGTPDTGAKTVTVAEFNAASESNDVWYQLTGVVKNLKDGDQYGNFDLEDETGSVYVYGLLSEKGGEKKKFQELAAAKGIKEGSKITIIGTRGSYNGKIEVMNAYFVKIEDGDSPGSDIKIITVADFNAAPESNDVLYQLTGTVNNLKDNDQYGNFDLVDSTGSVYVYGVLSEKGGEKKKFQELATSKGIKNGSTITIIGTRGSYNGKIEVMNAYFVSVSN
jgi:RPA family protein